MRLERHDGFGERLYSNVYREITSLTAAQVDADSDEESIASFDKAAKTDCIGRRHAPRGKRWNTLCVR
jgi:hypothetical protein